MKRIISALLIISVLSLGSMLVSCSNNNSGVPDGMQLINGSDALGFYFYGPEEWTLSNIGEISAAYASTVDNSSISYTEFAMPEGKTVIEYFTESIAQLNATNISGGESYTFGNADSATMFTFDFEYSSHKFRTMQIISKFNDRFGLFTYTSFNENMSSSDTVQFEFYKDKIRQVTDNFKYVTKNGEITPPTFDTKDEDGYLLVSDPKIAGFSLYLPSTFTANYSSGIITATATDGSSVSMSKATATGVSIDAYWTNRKNELSLFVTSFEEIAVNKPSSLGNANRAFSYEYTYVFGGESYHVYQVMGTTAFSGFVFTYTAKESNYATHFPEIEKIISKVSF